MQIKGEGVGKAMEKNSNQNLGQSKIKGGETKDTGQIPLKESEKAFKGFHEAKLFHSKDRATLTFYAGLEVASIHFDRGRGEIFYKGHNVKNMTLTQDQWLQLQNFSNYLKSHGAEGILRQEYEMCLSKVLPRNF